MMRVLHIVLMFFMLFNPHSKAAHWHMSHHYELTQIDQLQLGLSFSQPSYVQAQVTWSELNVPMFSGLPAHASWMGSQETLTDPPYDLKPLACLKENAYTIFSAEPSILLHEHYLYTTMYS